jgi:hypothetical protein
VNFDEIQTMAKLGRIESVKLVRTKRQIDFYREVQGWTKFSEETKTKILEEWMGIIRALAREEWGGGYRGRV